MKELDELKGTYIPRQALVLYTDENPHGNKYLEVVDIKNGIMCNPTPASLELVGKMVANVQYESQTKTIHWEGVIDPRLLKLHCTPDELEVIFKYESGPQMIHFRNEMFPSGVYHMPSLVFHVRNKSVFVYALGTKTKKGTALYRAPFLNVGNTGSTCMGSASIDDWKEYQNANDFVQHVCSQFWNSEFSEIHGEPVKGAYQNFLNHSKEKPSGLKRLIKLNKVLEDIL